MFDAKNDLPVRHPLVPTVLLDDIRTGGLLIVALTSVTALAATADNPIDYNTARLNRKLLATRAAGPIELDGRLDEPSWLDGARRQGLHPERPARRRAGDFRHRSAAALRRRRAVSSACSPRTIEPDEIIINELRKDFNTGNSDSFQVVIDTFHDERNGYQFAVNPAGAKWDAQMSNEGRETRTATGTASGTCGRASPKTAGMPRSAFRSAR